MAELKVGQKLWCVSRERYGRIKPDDREVTITKVGRKWAYLDYPSRDEYRIDKSTLFIDGGEYTSPGRCYHSREEYESELARETTWDLIRRKVDRQRSCPEGVSVRDMEAALDILRLGESK